MTELERLTSKLNALPEEQREALAGWFCKELEDYTHDPLAHLTEGQVAHIRKLVQEGLDSGPARPWDKDEFLARMRHKYKDQLSS